MRLLFSSTVGLGHLLPLLPLAAAAREAGHEVVVATGEVHRDRILGHELDFHALPQPPAHDPADGPFDPGENFIRRSPLAALPELLSLIGAWAPDVIIGEGAEFASGWAAERTGTPLLRVHPGAVQDHTWERLSAAMASQTRVQVGLPPDPDARRLIGAPQLSYFPSAFEPAVTSVSVGPILRVRTGDQRAVADEGRKGPVYITFGTEVPGMPMFASTVRAAVAAVRAVGRTGVLTLHHRADDAALIEELGDLDGISVERWVDQRQVIAEAPAVICHGGAGTLLAALSTATPIVVVPFFADQPYNADQLVATDTGVRVDPGPELESRLTAALQHALDGGLRGRAAMAAAMADLPDLAAAVSWIEQLAKDVTAH